MRTARVVLLSWIALFISVDLWCCRSTALGERIGAKGSCPGMVLLVFFMIVQEEFQTCVLFCGRGVINWKDRVEEMESERTGQDWTQEQRESRREMDDERR
jgi:hypothetical protein